MTLKEKILNELSKHFKDTFPDVLDRYTEMFDTMSDTEIKEFFTKKKGKIRLYVDDKKLKQSNVDKLVETTGVVLEEPLKLMYKDGVTTKHNIMVMNVRC